jgi:hypothetical protein
MSDRELSTRDLAERPEEAPAGDDQDAADEPDSASEPLARERAAEEPADQSSADADDEREPLLSQEQTAGFTKRWEEIQVGFVDEPRDSVAQADSLVADLMQQLAAGFSDERERLEKQWDSGDDVSTEDLRVALTRYRSFFNRLLSA